MSARNGSAASPHDLEELSLEILGGKWKMPILWRLKDEPRRYGALRRMLARTSQKMLAEQLRERERDGLITRKVLPTVPPKVEYAITAEGRMTIPVIEILRSWGEHFRKAAAWHTYLRRKRHVGIRFRTERIWVFTLALGLLMLTTSIGGLLDEHMYSQETPASLAQCIGQDIINLVVILPTLLVSGLLLRKGRRPALFVWLGATLYIIYTYVIYCFAVRFNALFLVYCSILGLSVYATITAIVTMDLSAVKGWFDEKRSVRTPSTFLFALALVFYLLWLKDIVPALIHGEIPQGVKEAGLMTNPVHVLDLSVVLPGFLITSTLLRKKHPYGYVFAPAFLIFAALMDITIGSLVVVMKNKGLAGDYALTVAFALLSLVTVLIFVRLMKNGQEAHSSRGAVP